ncbi:Putative PPM-type phosphatase domain, protein phosphatase 2C [Septoria linicola]|uniref:Protein phosphatase n=1 Tax=Septoria linicola TaxID=215465 RepID=A0A9Q9EMW0_9PEZI|nr:Putative PPM-type phosphatase domain, protein phosphatase 2C [Septoria linicola]
MGMGMVLTAAAARGARARGVVALQAPSSRRRLLWTCSFLAQEAQPRGDRKERPRSRDPQAGLKTPVPKEALEKKSQSPFYFESGYAGWAKRPSRPFPPPFFSPPSGSFSDPLSTHHRSMDRRPTVDGQMIRGVTNGDDAMLASESLIVANDGVGAWAQRERGHAPLWSRLISHFWALAAEKDMYGREGDPDPIKYLSEAYARTKEALSEPNEWFGTTTASAALLHYAGTQGEQHPVLYVTQLGDCRIMVVRPQDKEPDVIFSTQEQWHYFDCPRQLGTNSPDTPEGNAVLDKVDIEEKDIILAMSDGVTDNLWEEEIADYAVGALQTWKEKYAEEVDGSVAEAMKYVAQEIVLSARKIAEDPFAASPFMEKAVEEGLAIEGGKLDDISVVAAVCRRRKG